MGYRRGQFIAPDHTRLLLRIKSAHHPKGDNYYNLGTDLRARAFNER